MLGRRQLLESDVDRVAAARDEGKLGERLLAEGEQRRVRVHAVAAADGGDPLELLLDPAGRASPDRPPGCGEPREVAPGLAEADDDLPQLAGNGVELVRDVCERRQSPLGSSCELRRAVALLG